MRETDCLSGWMLKLPMVWRISLRGVSLEIFQVVLGGFGLAVAGSSSRSILSDIQRYS